MTICFPRKFEGNNADPNLSKKMAKEEELSGIFNVLMIALRRILHSKRIFVNEKTIQERREKYETAANPIGSFIKEAVAEDSVISDQTTKEHFYQT
jgi:phage/plasmid-associated DNA primase